MCSSNRCHGYPVDSLILNQSSLIVSDARRTVQSYCPVDGAAKCSLQEENSHHNKIYKKGGSHISYKVALIKIKLSSDIGSFEINYRIFKAIKDFNVKELCFIQRQNLVTQIQKQMTNIAFQIIKVLHFVFKGCVCGVFL